MTVRERVGLGLLVVACLVLTAAGFGFGGWPAGAVVLGCLTLGAGLALVIGSEPEPVTWVTVLHEWATVEDPGPLDFGELPVPERFQQLLEQLRG